MIDYINRKLMRATDRQLDLLIAEAKLTYADLISRIELLERSLDRQQLSEAVLDLVHEKFKNDAPNGFLIELFIPPDKSDDLVLALEDAFPRWVARYGSRKAKLIFHSQAIGIVLSFHWSKVKTIVMALAGKFGLDLVKRLFTSQ